jgi:hypothetical protein
LELVAYGAEKHGKNVGITMGKMLEKPWETRWIMVSSWDFMRIRW